MTQLIIGDLHFDTKYPGYLDAQLACLQKIVTEYNIPTLYLGDMSEKRQPNPLVLLALQKLFSISAWSNIVLRGNHDSLTKADDGVSYLELFNDGMTKVRSLYENLGNKHYIPHYEDENKINEILKSIDSPSDIIFGHFGFSNFINGVGDYDFTISPSSIPCTCIVGHIHQYSKQGNITMLGTPYTTNFTEAFKDNYVGILEENELKIIPVTHGPRHLVVDIKDLPNHRDFINDPAYYTILRVMIDPLDQSNTPDIIKSILNEYHVAWVDVKFKQTFTGKEVGSTFKPERELFCINESVIDDYINKSNTLIPKDKLKQELERIKAEGI